MRHAEVAPRVERLEYAHRCVGAEYDSVPASQLQRDRLDRCREIGIIRRPGLALPDAPDARDSEALAASIA